MEYLSVNIKNDLIQSIKIQAVEQGGSGQKEFIWK